MNNEREAWRAVELAEGSEERYDVVLKHPSWWRSRLKLQPEDRSRLDRLFERAAENKAREASDSACFTGEAE